jgi:hypothetical protein
LEDENTKLLNKANLTEKLKNAQKGTDVEELQECIMSAAKETLKVRWVGGTRKRHTPWWTDDVKAAVKEKTSKMRTWLKYRSPETREQYVKARNYAEQLKREAKTQAAINAANELNNDIQDNKKKIFKMAKAYRKMNESSHNIKDKYENVLTEPQ